MDLQELNIPKMNNFHIFVPVNSVKCQHLKQTHIKCIEKAVGSIFGQMSTYLSRIKFILYEC